ncbi:MAG: hypothetical protein L6420_08010 [Elusimicrobia bacterium]|nr:hypothetical protein [Elusimicrobiota bacterium]
MRSVINFIRWLLLAAVLTVPAFLFYNWWMNKKTVQMKENPVSSSLVNIPFESDEDDSLQPIAKEFVSTAPSRGQSQVTVYRNQDSELSHGEEIDSKISEQTDLQDDILHVSSFANTQITGGNTLGSSSVNEAPPKRTIAEAAQLASSATISDKQAQGVQEQNSQLKASYFEPKSDRDPTLSPSEYAQIKAEIDAGKERERQRKLEELKKMNSDSIQNQLTLQGIIGNNVIINGEMYAVGDYVKGVRIIKIGSNYFIGHHKGKQFKKVMR